MPSAQEFSVLSFGAKSCPKEVIQALEANPADANVILPFLKKSLEGGSSTMCSSDQVWLFCVSRNNGIVTVDMVLSCTENEMGKYPIFIVPTQPVSRWSPTSLSVRLKALAEALRDSVPQERVYSIFAPDIVVFLFSQLWSDLVGIGINEKPYYAARLLSCATVIPNPLPLPPSATCRLAVTADTTAIAKLCKGFSDESEPFVLGRNEAFKEASLLISKQQVWVYCVSEEITCIAAFTRNTLNMATITKVYTRPSCRGRGYARHLVREVTRHLLRSGRREVVLYVAHNNASAARVYESVGFVEPDPAVEVGHSVKWTEVGFDRNYVDLGHW